MNYKFTTLYKVHSSLNEQQGLMGLVVFKMCDLKQLN